MDGAERRAPASRRARDGEARFPSKHCLRLRPLPLTATKNRGQAAAPTKITSCAASAWVDGYSGSGRLRKGRGIVSSSSFGAGV